MIYTIKILASDIETLLWLSDRGYDGGFYNAAVYRRANIQNGVEVREYQMTEPDAWDFSAYIDADPDAFLTCCGSATLSKALLDFLDEIV